MTYYSSRTVALPLERAQQRIEEELGREGFGILSRIDVQRTFSDRLNVAFRPYRILGACHPALAHRAIAAEDMGGLRLPCNVVVQERSDGRTEVAVVDPVATMLAVDNVALFNVAREVRHKLNAVISRL